MPIALASRRALAQNGDMLHFHLVSLFPEFYNSPLSTALMAKAQEAGLIAFSRHDPRDHACDRHRTTDDRPYGGGPGMVMLAETLAASLREIPRPGRMLVMAPSGRPFTQALARELAQEENVTIICGRYEGLDGRLFDAFPLEPVSVGDVVLNGGETASLAVIEAVSRLVPGFMGKEASGEDESFSHGLLEYPQYTRPEVWEGRPVPDVLRGGNHAAIAAWRRQESLRMTLEHRPDLLEEAPLTAEDAAWLESRPWLRPGRNLFACLVHYPVLLGGKNPGASSLTNLDIHDIARTSRTYGLGGFYVATPLEDQARVLSDILRHWTAGPAAAHLPDRAEALRLVRHVRVIEEAIEDVAARTGMRPRVLATSAQWPRKQEAPSIPPVQVREWLRSEPVLLCFGTGRGLAPEALAQCDGRLRPLRFSGGYNHLSVRAAAAITLDRILGDFA